MISFNIGAVLTVGAMLVSGVGGAHAFQPTPFGPGTVATRAVSSGASSTVLATLVSRGGRLVVLVLWRGSPGWFGRGGSASSQGGSGGSQTWAQLTRGGDVTLSLDIDHTTGVARLMNQQVHVRDGNVFLIDRADTKAPTIRMVRVDPMVPDTPDAAFVVMKREPALIEFLQCDLLRADPFAKTLLAAHPCG